jgi:hypothetical protein
VNFRFLCLWYVAILKNKGAGASTATKQSHSPVSGRFKSTSINLIFCEESCLPIKRILHVTEFFNSHNTHIQQHKSGTMQQVLIYIEGHRCVLDITAEVLNSFSKWFLLTFPFTWFSLSMILHVFAALCIYGFFGYFIHI